MASLNCFSFYQRDQSGVGWVTLRWYLAMRSYVIGPLQMVDHFVPGTPYKHFRYHLEARKHKASSASSPETIFESEHFRDIFDLGMPSFLI